jgi:hypothetical protein
MLLKIDLEYIKRTIQTQKKEMDESVVKEPDVTSLNVILCHQQIVEKIGTLRMLN